MSTIRIEAYAIAFGGITLAVAAAWIYHLYVERANARDAAARAATQHGTAER